VKNVTVSLDEDTYRRARLKAAELGTSVSALVKHALQEPERTNQEQNASSGKSKR
jgi:post-segregation antitoxin (ccd killing protein)